MMVQGLNPKQQLQSVPEQYDPTNEEPSMRGYDSSLNNTQLKGIYMEYERHLRHLQRQLRQISIVNFPSRKFNNKPGTLLREANTQRRN